MPRPSKRRVCVPCRKARKCRLTSFPTRAAPRRRTLRPSKPFELRKTGGEGNFAARFVFWRLFGAIVTHWNHKILSWVTLPPAVEEGTPREPGSNVQNPAGWPAFAGHDIELVGLG